MGKKKIKTVTETPRKAVARKAQRNTEAKNKPIEASTPTEKGLEVNPPSATPPLNANPFLAVALNNQEAKGESSTAILEKIDTTEKLESWIKENSPEGITVEVAHKLLVDVDGKKIPAVVVLYTKTETNEMRFVIAVAHNLDLETVIYDRIQMEKQKQEHAALDERRIRYRVINEIREKYVKEQAKSLPNGDGLAELKIIFLDNSNIDPLLEATMPLEDEKSRARSKTSTKLLTDLSPDGFKQTLETYFSDDIIPEKLFAVSSGERSLPCILVKIKQAENPDKFVVIVNGGTAFANVDDRYERIDISRKTLEDIMPQIRQCLGHQHYNTPIEFIFAKDFAGCFGEAIAKAQPLLPSIQELKSKLFTQTSQVESSKVSVNHKQYDYHLVKMATPEGEKYCFVLETTEKDKEDKTLLPSAKAELGGKYGSLYEDIQVIHLSEIHDHLIQSLRLLKYPVETEQDKRWDRFTLCLGRIWGYMDHVICIAQQLKYYRDEYFKENFDSEATPDQAPLLREIRPPRPEFCKDASQMKIGQFIIERSGHHLPEFFLTSIRNLCDAIRDLTRQKNDFHRLIHTEADESDQRDNEVITEGAYNKLTIIEETGKLLELYFRYKAEEDTLEIFQKKLSEVFCPISPLSPQFRVNFHELETNLMFGEHIYQEMTVTSSGRTYRYKNLIHLKEWVFDMNLGFRDLSEFSRKAGILPRVVS